MRELKPLCRPFRSMSDIFTSADRGCHLCIYFQGSISSPRHKYHRSLDDQVDVFDPLGDDNELSVYRGRHKNRTRYYLILFRSDGRRPYWFPVASQFLDRNRESIPSMLVGRSWPIFRRALMRGLQEIDLFKRATRAPRPRSDSSSTSLPSAVQNMTSVRPAEANSDDLLLRIFQSDF